MLAKVKCVVVGGGVVGNSIARSLSLKGVECILCESNGVLGEETTGRNSEVIHAGMYYSPNSLKAKFCVEGKEMLIDFLKTRKIEYNLCGKLIIANDATEYEKLCHILERSKKNGVQGIKMLSSSDVAAMEPSITCNNGAMFSENTGVFDSHSYVNALNSEFESEITTQKGTSVPGNTVYNCIVERITDHEFSGIDSPTYEVHTDQGILGCDVVVNAAGLNAISLASTILPKSMIPKSYFCKGSYFKYQPNPKPDGVQPHIRHLIYPIPPTAHTGLGVHLTVDLQGAIKFGPDIEWMKPLVSHDASDPYAFLGDAGDCSHFTYKVDETRAEAFYDAIRRYLPSLQDGELVADYSGIRPKLCGPGFDPSVSKPNGSSITYDAADFYIQGSHIHGKKGLVNLFGIESPGLTSSLAIGEYVSGMVMKDL